MKETHTGLTKGAFWGFHCAVQAKTYTRIPQATLKAPGEPLALFLTILM